MAGKELKDTDAIKYHWYHNMEVKSCWKKINISF